jgi:hypothetical protein
VYMDFVHAASTVLGMGDVQRPACQRFFDGMERAPLLLLAAATAVLWLEGPKALPAALACGYTANILAEASWCEGREGRPCSICAVLLRPVAWPTVGLLSLVLQQVVSEIAMLEKWARSNGISSSDRSSCSGSGSGCSCAGGSNSINGGSRSGGGSSDSDGGSSSATPAASIAMIMAMAATPQQYLELAGYVLQVSLRRAVERASPVPLQPQQLQQVSWVTQISEAAVRCSARLQQLLSQHGEAASTAGAADDAAAAAAAFDLAPMLSGALFVCHSARLAVHDTCSEVASEVQQVLQAVMSLHLTTLSTAQGQPGAALPGVLLECAKMQQDIVQRTIVAAAAGAAQSLSATVAAGWFVVGRCLLEQLQLCLSQPDSYPLSAWLLTSEEAWQTSSDTIEGQRRDMHEAFCQLGAAVSLLDDTVKEWWVCFGQAPTLQCSRGSRMFSRYRTALTAACVRLNSCCRGPLTTFHNDLGVLDPLLEPSPAHQQQLLQAKGPAFEAFRALSAVCRTMKSVGEDLCAVLPNRYFCNNPGCRNAAGVSAGFALVRGAACVCGGCVGSEGAAGAAAAPQEAVAAR